MYGKVLAACAGVFVAGVVVEKYIVRNLLDQGRPTRVPPKPIAEPIEDTVVRAAKVRIELGRSVFKCTVGNFIR